LIYGENRELVEIFTRVYLNARTTMALFKKKIIRGEVRNSQIRKMEKIANRRS